MANVAPVNTVPTISTTGTYSTQIPIAGISVNDPDGNLFSTTLSVLHGQLTVDLIGGVTAGGKITLNNPGGYFSTYTSTHTDLTDSTFTLKGTQAQINSALATLTYLGQPGFIGTDTITISSQDSATPALTSTNTSDIIVKQYAPITNVIYDPYNDTLEIFTTNISFDKSIDVSKLSITGDGGQTYSLSSSNVSIGETYTIGSYAVDSVTFKVILNSADQKALDRLLNKSGTSSTGGTTYNLVAAKGWITGGDSASAPTDLTSSSITATLNTSSTGYDPKFNGNGRVVIDTSILNEITQILPAENGKVLVVGLKLSNPSDLYGSITLVRYNADGSLDPTFGSAGVLNTGLITGLIVGGALIDYGKILVQSLDLDKNITTLAAYDINGSLDKSFGTDGKFTISNPANGLSLFIPLLSPIDGSAELLRASVNAFDNDIYVNILALDATGQKKSSLFLGGGIANDLTLDANTLNTIISSPAVDKNAPNTQVYYDIIGSSVINELRARFAAVSYSIVGVLPQFQLGDNSILVDFLSGTISTSSGATSISLDASDSVWTARYVNGAFDPNFGINGLANFPNVSASFPSTLHVDKENRFLFASYSSVADSIIVQRLATNGRLDPSFGYSGTLTFPVGTNTTNTKDLTKEIDILFDSQDRAVIVVGDHVFETVNVFRINTNGTIDKTFGTNGNLSLPTLNGNVEGAFLESDNQLIIPSAISSAQVTSTNGTSSKTGNEFLSEYKIDSNLTTANTAPSNTIPATQIVKTNTQQAIAGISVNDVDGNLATTKLTVTKGIINLDLTGGGTISSGANDSASITLSGTQDLIDKALATLKYTGNQGFAGTDTLTIASKDSASIPLTSINTVNIIVQNVIVPTPTVNQPPVGAPTKALANTLKDTPITINASDLLTGFSDPNGDTLSVANLTAANGTLVNNNNGTYLFTPTTNYNGAVNLTYGVTDGITILPGQTRSFTVTLAKHDFNGDGKDDVVVRNKATGENAFAIMDGTAVSQFVFTTPVTDLNWTIDGAGDFNKDGKTDVVLRNKATGQNAIALMDGTVVSQIVYPDILPDPNWTIGGVGDFNNDGNADILYRNKVTGDNAFALMNGTSLVEVIAAQSQLDLNWEIGGVGDFNKDGKDDVVFRNKATGENAFVLLNGTTVSQIVSTQILPDLNWTIGAVGDYNNDGNVDVLYRNQVTGQNTFALLNGTTVSQLVPTLTVADTNWVIGA